MAESALPTQDDPRIGKARELAEYLRQNPREAKRDPEDLARQFGVSASLATQLSASRFITNDSEPQESGGARLKEAVRHMGSFGNRITGVLTQNPYLFLSGIAALFLVFSSFPHSASVMKGGVFSWLGAQAFCLFMRPKFRYVMFSAAWNAVPLIRYMLREMPHNRPPFDTTAGLWSFSLFSAVIMSLLGAVPMSAFMLLGGARDVQANRRHEASRSRHDLLTRMFELQERLHTLSPKAVPTPNPILAFIRRRLFLSSFFLAFLLGMMRVAELSFFKKEALRQMMSSSGGDAARVNVTVTVVQPAYLALSLVVLFLGFGGPILFGMVATTPRRFGLVLMGLAAGEVLSTLLPWPFGVFSAIPTYLIVMQGVWGTAVRMGIVLATRFGLYFHHSLTSLTKDSEGDESSIVSELLEIRHRLSASPAQVYVLVADAAGSTRMKEGMDPLLVEYSFRSYQAWLADVVGQAGGRVDAMTGDGAICAFGNADAAYQAAKRIQATVETMNREGNRLPMPFRLRIALHAGSVVADLDKVQFTNVIDVAAHVEKYSPVGGIAMTDPFMKALAGLPPLARAATVDGVNVYAMEAVLA